MKQLTERFSLVLIGLLLISAVLLAATSYTVTYDGNGNSGGSIPVDNNKYSAGQPVTVLGNTGNLVRTNYRFDGWNTKRDSSGINVAVGSTYTMPASHVVLYAKWIKTTTVAMKPVTKPVGLKPATVVGPGRKTIASSYTVTFDSQGASTPASPASKIVTSPATTVGSLPTAPIKTGYIFGGWYTDRNGGGSVFAEATAVTANITVYAKWSVVSLVDLVIEDIVLTPANPKNSDTVYINTKIKNQGTAFAYFPATNPGKIFTYSVNDRPYSGQGATPNLAIAPGAINDQRGYFFSPFQYAPGTYTIRAVADPDGKISESDETNNEKSLTFTLIDGGKPDLVISDIVVTPAQGTVNTTFRIEVTIKNQGVARFTSPVNANMPVLTGDQLPGQYASYQDQLVLEPNQTKTYIISLGPLQPGTRTWTYTVDSGNLISESDETNNQRSFTTIVQ
jgi:uncharacterized repeat protein (TIGR02543 family)